MGWLRLGICLGLICSGIAVAEDADDALAIKREAVPFPQGISPAMQGILEKDAVHVRRGSDEVAVIWPARQLTGKATAEQLRNGLSPRELTEGSVIGVVQFPKTWIDFRKQEIPAGTYSLRYVTQPDTGDHKDTAPQPDFALLINVDDDPTPDPLEAKQMIKPSMKVTGGDHPAVMLLWPIKEPGKEPQVVTKANKVRAVGLRYEVAVDADKAHVGIGLTVTGSSTAR